MKPCLVGFSDLCIKYHEIEWIIIILYYKCYRQYSSLTSESISFDLTAFNVKHVKVNIISI